MEQKCHTYKRQKRCDQCQHIFTKDSFVSETSVFFTGMDHYNTCSVAYRSFFCISCIIYIDQRCSLLETGIIFMDI